MKNKITKAQAKEFRKRWEIVARAQRRELQLTPVSTKFEQLAALMASVQQMGFTKSLYSEEAEVRKRWIRLREVAGV